MTPSMFLVDLMRVAACGVVVLISAVAAYPHADVLKAPPPGVRFKVLKGTHPWTFSKYTQTTKNVQKIHGFRSKTNSKSVAAILGAHQRQVGGYGYQNITTATAYGTQYATEALWSGRRMYLLLDTGSSDTWAVQKDFDCIDFAGETIPQIACSFGPAFPGDFQYGQTTPRQHMFIRYGDGETVTGPMGFSDITVGNITVKKQEVCLANTTYWYGNNMTSGLMGLAFPALTNAYIGSGLDHDNSMRIGYSSLFTSMVNQGKIPPLFSIAIDRNSSSGTLAWGGIAPATGIDTTKTVSLDLLVVSNLTQAPLLDV